MLPDTKYTPWNPDHHALKRVRRSSPIPSVCPYCNAEVNIKNNDAVYGKSFGTWPWVYLCSNQRCNAYVGLHPRTHLPLGTLADEKTRNARKTTKQLFNALWDGKNRTFRNRSEAYQWLATELCITADTCHFGMFDLEACRRAYRVLAKPR